VFLVDGNVESKSAIQEEIIAKWISIVNNEGKEVVTLDGNEEIIAITNKAGA